MYHFYTDIVLLWHRPPCSTAFYSSSRLAPHSFPTHLHFLPLAPGISTTLSLQYPTLWLFFSSRRLGLFSFHTSTSTLFAFRPSLCGYFLVSFSFSGCTLSGADSFAVFDERLSPSCIDGLFLSRTLFLVRGVLGCSPAIIGGGVPLGVPRPLTGQNSLTSLSQLAACISRLQRSKILPAKNWAGMGKTRPVYVRGEDHRSSSETERGLA